MSGALALPLRAHGPVPVARTAVALSVAWGLAACGDRSRSIDSIVVLTIDTLRADQLPIYGGPCGTPNLERLAAGALVFERAYSQAGITHPSLTSLWSGLLPSQHGIQTQWHVMRDDVVSVPELARDAGLATAVFTSNLAMLTEAPGAVVERGFQHRFGAMFDTPPDVRDQWEWDRAVLENGLDWLEKVDGPHLTWLHVVDPHSPHRPPPAVWDWVSDPPRPTDDQHAYFNALVGDPDASDSAVIARLWALYRAEIEGVDLALGPVVDWLERPEVREHTALVVAADHGEELFESWAYNEHRNSLSEGVLHVPLWLRAPGIEPGRVATPVELLQIAPTLLELLDLPVPYALAGPSLLAPRPDVPLLAELEDTLGSARYGSHRLWPGSATGEDVVSLGPYDAPWFTQGRWYRAEGGLAHYDGDGRIDYLDDADPSTRALREDLSARVEARRATLVEFEGRAARWNDAEAKVRLGALGYADGE